MSTEKDLVDAATVIARELRARAEALVPEHKRVAAEAARLEAEMKAAGGATDRLMRFTPVLGGSPQCPRCFVADGKQSRLTPIPGAGPGNDRLKCSVCGNEFSVSA